jgi:hypothetical protein
MIYVNNNNNQLNVTYDTRKDVYSFDSMKSVGFSWDTNGEYYVAINFIANDKNNSLRIYLKDVDPTLGWTNDFNGATLAVNTIAFWMDEVINVNANIVSPIGQQIMDDSVAVVIASDQSNLPVEILGPLDNKASADSVSVVLTNDQFIQIVTPNIILETIHNDSLGVVCYSISFASNGTAPALITFDGGISYKSIPAGTTISMDANGLGNYYPSGFFGYDTSAPGSSLIITWNE